MKKLTISRILLHMFLIMLSLTYVLPLVMLISISISKEAAIAQYGYTLFPKNVSFDAYRQALANPYQIIQSYKITIAYSVMGTLLAVFVQSLMAYPLSRANFKLKKFITKYLFITMLFSGGLVPSYILNTQYLHLGNTFWIYIFPSLVSAWNIIIFRTFFQNLPEGLVEAAKIDGAREFGIYFKIILPLSTPVLATLGFMAMLGKWNDWNTSLLYIRDNNLFSLQYLLQKILREVEYIKGLASSGNSSTLFSTDSLPTESMRYAMAVLAAGPMLVIFPFFQRYFTKGLVMGSVKG